MPARCFKRAERPSGATLLVGRNRLLPIAVPLPASATADDGLPPQWRTIHSAIAPSTNVMPPMARS